MTKTISAIGGADLKDALGKGDLNALLQQLLGGERRLPPEELEEKRERAYVSFHPHFRGLQDTLDAPLGELERHGESFFSSMLAFAETPREDLKLNNVRSWAAVQAMVVGRMEELVGNLRYALDKINTAFGFVSDNMPLYVRGDSYEEAKAHHYKTVAWIEALADKPNSGNGRPPEGVTDIDDEADDTDDSEE